MIKKSLTRIPAALALCLLNLSVLAPVANAAVTYPGRIGDYVWMDLNQDGIIDAGESGIQGVQVTLTKPGGSTTSVTTDANGYYYFSGLGPGIYTVAVATPTGLAPSPSLVGADQAVDSNGSGASVTVTSTQWVNNTIDFGFYPTGIIGNFVWQDLNQNGIQESGEPGIAGVTVNLENTANPGTVLLTAVTSNTGAYLFTGLPAGTYKVIVDTSSPSLNGFVPTLGMASSNAEVDGSDASPQIVALPTQGAEVLTANFGFILTPPGTIGNFVWFDRNGNGIQDSPDSEPGISGVTVQLYDLDQQGVPMIAEKVTALDGSYLFEGLLPGNYRVVVDDYQPALDGAGYLPTLSQVAETTTANDSNLNPTDVTLVLTPPTTLGGITSTSSDTTVDFGYYRLSSLSGYVYVDANDDGEIQSTEVALPGVTVTLTGTDLNGDAMDLAITTDINGFYQFFGLLPGSYTITESQPAGYNDGKDTLGTQGGEVTNDVFSAVLLGYAVDGENYNFGERPVPPSSLSGYVYLDNNNNGVRESGEMAISGVAVRLTGTNDINQAVEVIAVTDGNGFYQLTGLRPGTYTITESQPPAFLDGKDAIGTQGGILSDDSFSNIVLAGGINGTDYNFGELGIPDEGPKVAFLSGYVYLDANNDGIKDANEAPISGVTVTVIGMDATGNSVNTTATSDATGLYSFLLPPSDATGYIVTQTQPDGYLDGKDTIGTPGGTTANDLFSNVVLNSGVNGTDNNFGERLPAAGVSLVKTVDKPKATFGESVTYTYVVTNTGGIPLTNVVIVDDNATPTVSADDFTVGAVALLAPGASQTFTRSLVPPAPTNESADGSSNCGVIITEHCRDGKTKFTYLQGKNKRSYCSKALFRVRDKTGAICKEIEGTNCGGDGSKYVNSFTVLVDTATVRKSDGSVNLPDVCHKSGWDNESDNDSDSDCDKDSDDDSDNDSDKDCDNDRDNDSDKDCDNDSDNDSDSDHDDRDNCWDDDDSKPYDCDKHPEPCRGNMTNIATVTAKAGALTVTATGRATVCIQPTPAPKVSITKKADVSQATVGVPVTYTYVVTNTGGVALTNIKVIDDNATPTILTDDVQVGILAGPLAPSEAVTFTRTLVPPVPMGTDSSGKNRCGTLITEKRSDGKTKFTYCQSKDERSEYSSKTGWKGERAYSRKTQFRVWSSDGKSCSDVASTLGTCNSSDYVNCFSVLVNTSSVCDSKGSVKLPDVCHKSGWNGDWRRDWDRDCGDWNRRNYWDDHCATWDRDKRPVPCVGDVTNIAIVTAKAGAIVVTAKDSETVKVSPPTPKVAITKTADKKLVAFGVPVTYTYVVTNTGGVALSNLKVMDDNASPTITSDDVEIGTVAGTLAPGASVTFTKTLIPTLKLSSDSYGTNHCGTLITECRSDGTTKFTYCQEKDERDSYTTSSGWKGDRSYCRKTQFRVWKGNGKTYGDVDGTLEACDAPDHVNGFSVVVNTSSVCKSDGSIKLPDVCHKSGWARDWRQDWDRDCGDWNRRSYWDSNCTSWDRNNRPKPCASDVTNIATVTATGGSVAVTAKDSETVKVSSNGN